MGCPKTESGIKKAANGNSETPVAADTRPEGVVGYYRLEDPDQYGAKSMKDVPIGQIRYLGIEKGRWMLRDMMVGFGGTWVATKSGALLTTTDGPSGPVKDEEPLEVVRTDNGLSLLMSKDKAPDLAFTYVAETAPSDFGYDEFFAKKK